ncbi:ABC transporter substrate-binding protein [Burkholderia pseudomultivorans]|uniref:SsuA/THI5-like domain-containing protein n=1 Tax=Burkholderia pseudomultivorans TaxID=1207504 RepID=A0A132EX74_9BURK|nr:ABC transporter substrate-binding protein [Burkholderia pseudomultivorans]KWF60985.1 hypothetical protein WT57_02800 [Burkholderia pseudomultivorans]
MTKFKILKWCQRKTFFCVALLASTAFAAGNGSDNGKTITFGMYPTAGTAPFNLAQDAGYFKAEGLTVNFTNVVTTPDGIANLMAGKQQIAILNIGALASALQQGLPLRAVAAAYYWNPKGGQGLFTKKGSSITRPRDLEGKTVGVNQLKGNFDAMVIAAVRKDGGDPSKVRFRPIPLPNIPAAIVGGTIGAGLVGEPYYTQHKAELAPVIPDPTSVFTNRPAIAGYAVTTQKYAAEHPDNVKAFQAAYTKAVKAMASNDQLARQTVAKTTTISANDVRSMILPLWSEDLGIASAKEQMELLVKVGYITKVPDLSAFFGR